VPVGCVSSLVGKAGLCNLPEEYYFSSALFYEKGIDKFHFFTHYNAKNYQTPLRPSCGEGGYPAAHSQASYLT
jgi:hypothetical protein